MTFDEWMAENWPHALAEVQTPNPFYLESWLLNAYEAGALHQEETQPDPEELYLRKKERE